MQNDLIYAIWVNSQKYLILSGYCYCIKPYPEIISNRYEMEIMKEMRNKIKEVHNSNYRMGNSLEDIRTKLTELKIRCDKLDYTVESPFLIGTYYLKSLSYTRNLIENLFQYFYKHIGKLKCWAELLTPEDSTSIEDYMALIQPSKEYENNITEYTDSCKCMRSKRFERIKQKSCVKN
ncbi:uncharacterized protein [Musca autumnalis]|uniref:uncharacterized protein n=1 Tax=Musca autumnalis TaxID=221902 RepID=UPI003CEBB175